MAQAAGTVSDTPLRAAPSSSRLSQAACSAFALAPYPAPHKCMVTAQPLLHSCAAGCLTMSNGDSSAYCQHTRRKQLLERTCRFPFKERYFVLGVGPVPRNFATVDTNPDVFQQQIRHARHLPMYWSYCLNGITTSVALWLHTAGDLPQRSTVHSRRVRPGGTTAGAGM